MCCFPAQPATSSSSLGSQTLTFHLEVDCTERNQWAKDRLLATKKILKDHLSAWLRPHSMAHARLLRDVRVMKRDVLAEEGEIDVVVLATKLTSCGYRVHLRSALGASAGTTDCFFNLRNEFLVVSDDSASPSDEPGTHFIVEAHFRDHFEIPHPTERYAGLLEAIPPEIVLSPDALSPLLQFLCAEMQLAFKERGLSLPPWRQSKSLLSKWLPAKARDLDVSSPTDASSPRGGAGSPTYACAGLYCTAACPSALCCTSRDGESPRAVLSGAAAVLAGRAVPKGGSHLRPGAKPRSLLSADLAASGCATPKHQRTPPAASESSASPPPEWVTPPIRRVRMAGGRA